MYRRLDFEWADKNRFWALQKETEKNLEKVGIVRNMMTGLDTLSEKNFYHTASDRLAERRSQRRGSFIPLIQPFGATKRMKGVVFHQR